ncbi:MAG: PHP domain-containing protein [Ignavibacteria bacterium]|nr:PHP domain-containing protein [Ignavibacteria bacterium]
MKVKADLHLHSNFSDGRYSVEEVVEKAIKKNLKVISITDHDTIEGVELANEVCEKYGITNIPGVEVSSEIGGKEIHILGYFIDIKNSDLKFYLQQFKLERLERAERILSNLKKLGVNLTIEEVMQFSESKPITRPHIAFALIKKKIVSSYYEAFEKYLGDYSKAYEKKNHSSKEIVIELIHSCGGLAFLAHPYNLSDGELTEIIKSKIDGIEIYHPTIKHSRQLYLHKLCVANSLLESGGSDFHGGHRNDYSNFGKFGLDLPQLNKILNHNKVRKVT